MIKNYNFKDSEIFLNVIVVLFILLISIGQVFPENYFFSSGDSVQIISFKSWFSNNNSLWSDNHVVSGGLGLHNNFFPEIPYHFIVYLLSSVLKLGIGEQSFLHHFIFYTCAYFSISFYLKNSLGFLSNFERIFASLIYVFNIVVFYVYFYTWGYTPFYFLYIFIPLLFAYFDIVCKIKNIREVFIFCLKITPILILFNISFRNPAFLLSLFFVINLYIFYYFFINNENYKHKLIKALIFNFFLVLTFLPSLSNLILYINESSQGTRDQIWDQLSWVKGQAASFPKPFYMFEGFEMIKKNFFVSFQYLFFIFLVILLLIDGTKSNFIKHDRFDKKKYFFIFFLILFIFFHNKGIDFLSDSQIHNFFVNSFYYIFRSSDKVIIYYPFITLVLLVILTRYIPKKIYVLISVLIFNSLICYPLFTGKVKTNHDLAVGENENFTLSEYAMIKKYSKDYKSILKILENKGDANKSGIINLPFTGFTSPNWSNYQKSQHVGYDPYTQFFKHKIFSLNNWTTKELDFIGRSWNQAKLEDNWYKKVLKIFPNKYVIFHKDTHDFIYDESIDKIKLLEKENIFSKIYEGKQLILYEIDSKYSNELIYLPSYKIKTSFKSHKNFSEYLNQIDNITNENYIIEFGDINYNDFNELINNEKFNKKFDITTKNLSNKNLIENYYNQNVKLKFKKISSTSYEIELINAKNKNITISFLQTFSKFWRPEKIKQNFELVNHFKCNGYANCFTINASEKNLKFKIEYSPQSIVNKILIIEVVMIILSLITLSIFRKKNEN